MSFLVFRRDGICYTGSALCSAIQMSTDLGEFKKIMLVGEINGGVGPNGRARRIVLLESQ